MDRIIIRGARQHNLKNVDLELPRNKLVVITGVSGSGKSSLAFDTLFAEGQRRYIEALSTHARQFLQKLDAPLVEEIRGLSPAIAIEQKGTPRNPRSTVGTLTEIYDYLRILYARLGTVHCLTCGAPVRAYTVHQMIREMLEDWPEGARLLILAPLGTLKEQELSKTLRKLRREGFARIRLEGKVHDLDPPPPIPRRPSYNAEVVVDRLILSEAKSRRIADSLELAARMAAGLVSVAAIELGEKSFSESFRCTACGAEAAEPTPSLFSFHHPSGSCPECKGLGFIHVDNRINDNGQNEGEPVHTYDPRHPAVHPEVSKGEPVTDRVRASIHQHERGAARFRGHASIHQHERGVDQDQLAKDQHERVISKHQHESSSNHELSTVQHELSTDQHESPGAPQDICPRCHGTRLNDSARAVRLGGIGIHEASHLPVSALRDWLGNLPLSSVQSKVAERPRQEMIQRLNTLEELGLSYLTLDRSAHTISGGEAQRIRLAQQISTRMSGVLYVLDEPSIGLHPRDHQRLLDILFRLRDTGNSVVVVEHDRETILQADHVVDMGPGAGALGGEVIFSGPPSEMLDDPKSLTGLYLSGKMSIPVPKRRPLFSDGALSVAGASGHNLKNITVSFPLGCITAVTGVSGSGKSTLVLQTLYAELARRLYGSRARPAPFSGIEGAEHISKVILVDQSPLGRTPRSTPATYTGLFSLVRQFFAELPEARSRGYGSNRFSFNVKGGRCEACKGEGLQRIEMFFLPDVYVTCPVCRGSRYSHDTLDVRMKGHSIAEVLDMTISEAASFFENIPPIRGKLRTLQDVGLGYLKLGQPATTLSGGEAQRVKLASELGRRASEKALYILDEPTTGLHFDDIQKLLHVLQRLSGLGHTVILIEHHPDVVKTADYVIDLGPEGGEEGGYVVAAGTPEQVAGVDASYTGKYLKGR